MLGEDIVAAPHHTENPYGKKAWHQNKWIRWGLVVVVILFVLAIIGSFFEDPLQEEHAEPKNHALHRAGDESEARELSFKLGDTQAELKATYGEPTEIKEGLDLADDEDIDELKSVTLLIYDKLSIADIEGRALFFFAKDKLWAVSLYIQKADVTDFEEALARVSAVIGEPQFSGLLINRHDPTYHPIGIYEVALNERFAKNWVSPVAYWKTDKYYGSMVLEEDGSFAFGISSRVLEDRRGDKSVFEPANMTQLEKRIVPFPDTPSIGEAFELDDLSITINKLEWTPQIGRRYSREKTDPGSGFLIVYYTLRNIGKATITISASNMTLIDIQDRRFSTSSRGQTALMSSNDDVDFLLTELQPGIPKRTAAVFEVPNNTFHNGGFSLEIPAPGILNNRKTTLHFPLPRK